MAAAAVKKPVKRRDPSSPNTALVIFLVFFSLASIGLGVWGYYGYAGQEKLKKAAEDAGIDKKTIKDSEEWYRFRELEWRYAIEPEKIEPDDKTKLDEWRKKFFDKGFAKVSKDDDVEAVTNLIKKNRDLLGWNEANVAFDKSYPQRLLEPQQENKRLEALLAAKEQKIADLNKELSLGAFKEQDKIRKELEAKIAANHAEALAEAKKPPKALDDAIKQMQTARKERDDNDAMWREKFDKVTAQLTKAEVERDDARKLLQKDPAIVAAEVAAKAGVGGRAHGLNLDLSTGKPLWDLPVGKIVAVDLKDRRVVVNLGHNDKVRPELTFTVFGHGLTGKADGYMKGTIEIQKILGAHTSEAVITSMYDIEGREIPINDSGRTRVQREASNPMKDGDLLFNAAWGTHVVIVGPVNWTGVARNNPSDQMRQLGEFKAILERQGVTVDSYLDLNDGSVKGSVTPMTRFMIKGDFLPPDLPESKSSKRVQDVNLAMVDEEKNTAIPKGLFIISSSNFAMLIGYRAPRSADDISVSGFRPRAPYSGSDFLELLRKKDKANEKKEKMDKKADDGK
jgi:hypothetical protein